MSASRIRREKKTIRAMIALFCKHHHQPVPHDRPARSAARPRAYLCADCRAIYEYALFRLDHCPFKEAKPACGRCRIHCYQAEQRAAIRAIMRFAGPRMLLCHPFLTVAHLADGFAPRKK